MKLVEYPRQPALWLIRLYQKTLSPDHGPLKRLHPYGFCRFHPTCSAYSHRVIERDGLLRGTPKALYRIARCNPFNKGGEDLP